MSSDKEESFQAGTNSALSSSLSLDESRFIIYNRINKEQILVKKDWTEEEEKRARRKVDFIIIPLLFFAFFILQLDRGNIGNALTDTLMEDLGINQDQVNVGTALFNIGIVIFEIPSNVVLQKIGPGKWLSFQIIVWSVVATVQSEMKNYSHYLALRFIVGMCEGGFIPGALFYLSTWYTRKELTFRYTGYFFGNMAAGASSGLIAAGILKNMPGRYGLQGWKWIFIIEGVIGVAYGLIFLLLIPTSSTSPRPWWSPKSFNMFNEREQYILSQRVIIDDPEKLTSSAHIGFKEIWATFKQPHIWFHFILSLSAMIHPQSFSKYTPLIIRSLGYTQVAANARSSIPAWFAIILIGILTYTSNKFKPRGRSISFLLLWQTIFTIVLRLLPDDTRPITKFCILVMLLMPGAGNHILNTSWVLLNAKTPTDRSVALAMMVMAANIAGICGGQVLRDGDRPYYHKGVLAIVIVDAFAFLWSVFMVLFYIYANKKLSAGIAKEDDESVSQPQESENHSTTVVFVGRGSHEDDEAFLKSLEGDYNLVDKHLEAVQNLSKFKFTP